MPKMKTFFVGVKGAILNKNNQLLLLKTPKGYWELPGGRIDADENVKETLTRELNEELPNIKNIGIGKIIHAIRMPFDIKEDISLFLAIYGVKADFDGKIQISDEHVAYKWVDITEASILINDIGTEFVEALGLKQSE